MSTGAAPSPQFPGHLIKIGSTDKQNVIAIQKRLNQVGCGPVDPNGVFGAEVLAAVELFQMRSVDFQGRPLAVDGEVGSMTWGALFGLGQPATVSAASSPLLAAVVAAARAEIGVREEPPGSNRGPKVDQYLRSVGLDPADDSFPWCAAFVYWCFAQSAKSLGVENPATKTAGAVDIWVKAPARRIQRIAREEAKNSPALVQPGMVFVISTGSGHGHCGFIETVQGTVLTTIEGNTNEGGSREGIGVFERVGRRIGDINLGFVNYSVRV